MKIRSLVLGSVAAAGLSTAGYAADLGVLTSLDVCDQLGLSGLTISSDENCLQISGGVEYEFRWGNYAPGVALVATGAGSFDVPDDGVAAGGQDNDWHSKVKAWVKFVGTAASDFGPASAVIKLQQKQYSIVTNEGFNDGTTAVPAGNFVSMGSGNPGVVLEEAYVSVGDSTVIMAGKKGSIMKFTEDEPLNFLGLFNSEKVDKGVKWGSAANIGDGGHVIQIATDLGNGVSIAAGLEKLDGAGVLGATNSNISYAGTAFGVVSYAGDGIAAHLTVAAAGVLDGVIESWGYHAGFAGTFDVVKIVAAIAGDNSGYWNGLASAAATFDMFTLAASVEAVNTTTGLDYGFGVSGSAAVTDTVSINLGGRWYHDATAPGNDAYQIAAQLVAAVTETITLTGEVGLYDSTTGAAAADTFYGAATVAWAPGGGFTTSLKGEAYSNGAYRATFKAAKTFQ